MRRIFRLSFFCAIGIGACFVNEALSGVQGDQRLRQQSDGNAQLNAKLRLLASLPIGIKITHSPNPARARVGGRSGFGFTWPYTTSVQTISGSVKIEEFGAFAWEDGRWVFSNFTCKPYGAADFADWYGILALTQRYFPVARVLTRTTGAAGAPWSRERQSGTSSD